MISFLNPLTAPVEGFRYAMYGVGGIEAPLLLLSLGMTAVVMFFGLMLFSRNEQTFVDVV